MSEKTTKISIILLCMFFVIMTCSVPLIQNEIVLGDDFQFHLFRIAGLAEALASGNAYPVGVYTSYFQGWGYAVGLFYPDFFLLPFSYLHTMGLGIILTYKLFFLSLCFFCCLTSYFAGRGLGKSHAAGLLLMVGYGLSQYHLCNLLSRSAVGESLSMIFIPLFIWGLYNLTEEKFTKPWIIIVATVGLLLSHVLSSMIVILFGCLWCVLRIRKLCSSWKWIAPMLLSILLVFSLSCFYCLPFLEQFLSNEFQFSLEGTKMAERTLCFANLLALRFAPGLGIGGAIMMFLIPTALGILIYRRMSSSSIRLGAVYFCCALLIFALSMTVSFWQLMDDYSPINIQFTWRLNLLSHFFLYLSAAVILSQFKRYFYPILGVVMGLGMLSSMFFISDYKYVNYSREVLNEDDFELEYLSQAGWGKEWLPLDADLTAIFNSNKALYTLPNGEPAQGQYLESGGYGFSYDGEAGKYKIPLIWYKGYGAYHRDAHAVSTPLHVSAAEDGSVLVSIPEGLTRGEVLASYQGTAIQKWSFYVSCVTALLVLLYLAFACWRYVKTIRSGCVRAQIS